MKKILPFLLLFICSQAEAKIFIKPFDQTGARTSSDITIPCDSGKILQSQGGGVWVCVSNSGGSGAPTDAEYFVQSSNATLTNEVVVTKSGVGSRMITGVSPFTSGRVPYFDVNGDLQASSVTSADATAVTLAGENYATLSGQEITFADINLGSHVTSTLPIANGGTGITSLGAGVATWLGTPSAANLRTAVTGTTGTSNLVFSDSPTLTTPNLGTPSAATLTNATGLPLTTGVTGTLGISNGGTGRTSISNDAVLVGNNAGTGFDAPALTDCVGSDKALNYTASTNTWSCNTFSSGGAPTNAQYVTLATDGTLSDERVLTRGNGVFLIDGGAGSTITVSMDIVTVSQDALAATTSSPSGGQFISNRFSLLQGCSDGQVLAWDETADIWKCATAGGGSGDITDVGDVSSDAAFTGTQGTILQGINGSGTDASGTNLEIAGGKGTGQGSGGLVEIKVSPAGGASGSSLNDFGLVARFNSDLINFYGSTDGSYFDVSPGNLTLLSSSTPFFDAEPGQVTISGECYVGGVGEDGTGKVACIKSDGNLGTCSSVVGSGGTCTCG